MLSAEDLGLSTQVRSRTTQALDQLATWPSRGSRSRSLGAPARTYANTYVTASPYTSRYIVNRLASSVLNSAVTLVSDGYGTTALTAVSGLNERGDVNYGTGNLVRAISLPACGRATS